MFRSSNRHAHRIAPCLVLASLACPALAGTLDYGIRQLPDKSGMLEDEGPVGARIEVTWTTCRNNVNIEANNIGYPGTIPPNPNGGDRNSVKIRIPQKATFTREGGGGSESLPVTDFHQKVTHPSITNSTSRGAPEGATNYLGGAAYRFLTPDHMRMSFLEDAIFELVGDDVRISIPDGFGDTNGDGVIGDGDVIYSAVNLYEFAPARSSWSFGQFFDVVDGVCDLLPGMAFGTAPITFSVDAAPFGSGRTVISGMDNPQPYTGSIRIDAAHTVSVPAPSIALMLAPPILFTARRRR